MCSSRTREGTRFFSPLLTSELDETLMHGSKAIRGTALKAGRRLEERQRDMRMFQKARSKSQRPGVLVVGMEGKHNRTKMRRQRFKERWRAEENQEGDTSQLVKVGLEWGGNWVSPFLFLLEFLSFSEPVCKMGVPASPALSLIKFSWKKDCRYCRWFRVSFLVGNATYYKKEATGVS